MGLLSKALRYPFGVEAGHAAMDVVPSAVRHVPFGVGVGALAGGGMTPEGSPTFELGNNVTAGMGLGAMGGAALGGSKGVARVARIIFDALQKEHPQLDSMTAWAIAERKAHDLSMRQGE